MFGLVRINGCSLNPAEKNDYLSLYCGTCKSIALLYGQSSRLYLNSDIVFLAGIIKDSYLSDENLEFSTAGKCFSLPEINSIPSHVRFAAYANVMLAYMNLEDKIFDEKNSLKKIPYKFLRLLQRRRLTPVIDDLKDFNLLMQEQLRREKSEIPECLKSTDSRFEYYSEITEKMMMLTMEKCSIKKNESLNQIFTRFCRILYVLDALEDFDSDKASGHFNAMQASLGIKTLEKDQHEMVAEYLFNLFYEISMHIDKVILSEEKKFFYKTQLYNNLSRRLDISGTFANIAECKRKKEIISWSSKWHHARSFLEKKYQHIQTKNKLLIEIRRASLSVMLMILPYPVWAASSGDEPGACAQCLGAACCFYCCCSKNGRNCLGNLCGGAAIACCCCPHICS